ncbi:hypothetical protein PPYR_03361 [Photinus pyralis]|uniref:Metalloendopeptidase n=1 Tax=Photinus pyralis TaxID=7054 RepID=A0A5N4A2N7_PHOPY|nr:zinc metalloproteinase nas-13-like [Photinus pyralis]KAB0791561.1 hypothetical protein PPYR_03361 [Photinus pyralis]
MLVVSLLLSGALCAPTTDVYEKSGINLNEWREESGVNPEETGEYFEGDILLPADYSKNGLLNETYRWTGAVIPYEIVGLFSSRERELIARAMGEYHKHTCIRFRPKTNFDADWVTITSTSSGCWSSVGRSGGRQIVNLQSPGCLTKIGTTIHELLHACGFYHEQNRYDRDLYVAINWENIQETKKTNFRKIENDTITIFEIDYDYGSVMHYSAKAFSANGQPTITTLKENVTIGQRDGFSESDLVKLRKMYNCDPTNQNSITNGSIIIGQNSLIDLISILLP